MRAVVAMLVLLMPAGLRTSVAAQSCESGDRSLLLRVTHNYHSSTPRDRAVWATGGALEHTLRNAVTLRGQYVHEHSRNAGVALRTAAVGGSIELDVPFRPCIGLAVMASRGSTRTRDDHFYNLTVPLAIGRTSDVAAGPATLSLHAAGLVIYSASDARLFGFDMSQHHAGLGATVMGTAAIGPVSVHVELRQVALPDGIGPTALGARTIEVGTGYRF